jgi:catechol 2,3-dioxygenase-like lactoylglutathione lyase family enzyme
MSTYFGGIRQNGYVVQDLDTAIHYWTTVLGVGPFYRIDHVPLTKFIYEGAPSNPDLNIALANSGDVQIELIHQLNGAQSPYRDFLQAKGAGLQHISVWSQNYDSDLDRLGGLNLTPTCDGEIAGATRFAYFRTDNLDGTTMEIADLASLEYQKIFGEIHRSAATWDGDRPVRDFFGAFAELQG